MNVTNYSSTKGGLKRYCTNIIGGVASRKKAAARRKPPPKEEEGKEGSFVITKYGNLGKGVLKGGILGDHRPGKGLLVGGCRSGKSLRRCRVGKEKKFFLGGRFKEFPKSLHL